MVNVNEPHYIDRSACRLWLTCLIDTSAATLQVFYAGDAWLNRNHIVTIPVYIRHSRMKIEKGRKE
jgi:hypothetical protein